jgi:hypothetical protein
MWRKSTHRSNIDCVEVAFDRPEVLVRDTKDRTGGTLTIPAPGWRQLLSRLR